jgi:hypothetical protein
LYALVEVVIPPADVIAVDATVIEGETLPTPNNFAPRFNRSSKLMPLRPSTAGSATAMGDVAPLIVAVDVVGETKVLITAISLFFVAEC